MNGEWIALGVLVLLMILAVFLASLSEENSDEE